MSDVNGVNAQAISSLQASTPPSTLQAAANLMSSPLAGSNLINTPFSNRTGWNQAINQKVMYMVGNGEQTAKLTLNPPDLGPLQVVISVNNEKADTTFISANEDVRQALEDGLENLREKMGEAGVALGQANVNTGEQFAQQQQSTQKQTNNTPSNQSVAETEAIVNSTPVARNSNGLVDTFA
jgi:flagellar hook-length control protein FliK